MLLSVLSFAQNNQEKCGFDQVLENQITKNPEFKNTLQKNEVALQKFMQQNKNYLLAEDEYVVPVVFHVVHLGENEGVGSNISDAQIASGLQQLNDGWSNANGSGVDIKVTFQLATKDPNCNNTSGIVRVDGRTVSNYENFGISTSGQGADDASIKALSNWPNSSYYNIWVVTEIDGNNGGAGTQGYAYFPGAGDDIDGTVIMHTALGNTGTVNSWNNDGGTLIHEMGHGMGLWHTFEGSGVNQSGQVVCASVSGCGQSLGDCCDDTEPHQSSSSSCPSSSDINSCTGVAFQGVQYNYMDYSSCTSVFTQDQKDRVRANLLSQRSGLINSPGLSTSSISFSAPSAASCSPQTSSAGLSGSYDEGINKVSLAGVVATSSTSYNDAGYVDNSSSCLSLMQLDENSTNTITLNIAGASTRYTKAWIDYNNDGSFDNSTEMIVDANISPGTDTDYSFTIPSNATLDQTLRLRVSCDWSPVSNGCDAPEYGQVEDYPVIINSAGSSTPPVAEFTASITTICVGSTIDFTDNSTNTPTSWSWSISGNEALSSTNQNPSLTFNTAGTYTVALTATNGDGSHTETKTDYITVNALPTVSFTAGSSATVTTTDGSQALTGSPTGGTYSGTEVSGTDFDPATAGVGTHTVTYSYTDSQTGCSATATFIFTVTDGNSGGGSNPPIAEFTASETNVCIGSSIDFTDNSTNTPTSWSWVITGNESLSSTEQNPSFTFSTAGVYEVALTASNNDGSDSELKVDYITVNELPSVSFTAGSSASVYTNSGLQALTGSPSGGTYSGTGVSGNDFDPSVAGVGNHIVSYSYADSQTGCSSSATFEFVVTEEVVVNEPPIADFSISSGSVCVGNAITFTDASDNSPSTWVWSITGPTNYTSSDQNPSFTFSTAGTYSVSLTVSNNYGSDDLSQSDVIVINSNPEFVINDIDPSCYGSQDGMMSIAVTNGTTNNQYSIGGATQSSNVFTNLMASTYTITVIDGNTCFTMDEVTLTQPEQITGSSTIEICPGEATVVFGQDVNSAGTYTDVFASASGCDSTHNIEVIVNELPTISFGVFTSDTVYLDAGLINIGNVSPIGGEFSGDGVFSNMFNPAFAGVGTHEITYTYTDNFTGCSASEVFTFVVLDLNTGLNTLNHSYSIYPNPVTNQLNVEGNDIEVINVWSSLGQLMTSTNNQKQLDFSQMASGIYIIELINTKGFSTKQRIVKQ